MTTKNTILLIVKQNPGIDYNSLLSKFSSSYLNINSARAALSRSIKDLIIFGFLFKKSNRFFITDKGESEIFLELKNKLVITLNNCMNQKNPVNNIDDIVQRLQIVIERSREDKSLMKLSRTSLNFSLSDLELIQKNVDKKISHLNYISKVFGDQLESLKELDFNDSFSESLNKESALKISKIFGSLNDSEFAIECSSKETIEKISSALLVKARAGSITLPEKKLPELLTLIMRNDFNSMMESITIFSSAIKVQFYKGKALISGPYSALKEWK